MTEKTFVKQLEKFFYTEGFLTKREVDVGYGVADLVLVKLNPEKCTVRAKNKQFKQLLKEQFFKIFQYLPDEDDKRKPVSLDYLVEKTSISKSFLKYTLLTYLKKEGYIKEINKRFYIKVNGWMPIAEEIIAIEAKLKDWKRGFVQANRYKSFANKVYLAIPSEKAHLVNRALLKKHNVGFIAFDARSSEIKKAVHPRAARPRNFLKFNFAAEFFLNKRILQKAATL